MKKKLHPKQQSLLDLLSKNIDEPLTYRDLQNRLDISSTSVVAHHLKQLEKKGYLKRNPSNPRDYQILIDGPEKQIAYLNLYGLASAGLRGNILDGNPIERIPIPTRLLSFRVEDAYLVRAKGDSMSPKIVDGDIVIAMKTDVAANNKIVVCVNKEEALIKRVQKEEDRFILISDNPTYSPLLASQDFRIVGEVKGIFSNRFN